MSQITLILIHAGNSELPQYLRENFEILSGVAKNSRIVFLANQSNFKNFEKLSSQSLAQHGQRIEFFAIDDIPRGETSVSFEKQSTLDKVFRDGFWYQTSNRFMVLSDYMRLTGIQNVVHIENDYVLYFDPSDKFEAFNEFSDFAAPLDRIRAIPGIVWIKNSTIAEKLAAYIARNPHRDDMFSVGEFCLTSKEIEAKPLPTIPKEWGERNGLDLNRYSQGIDLFGGIFDAAAIGQYIGGIHWMNNPTDTTFFQNESSDLQLEDLTFSWGVSNGIRYPILGAKNEMVKVLGVHAHSKNLNGISPFNHGIPNRESSVVTGERIQECCEITLSTPSITSFHGRQNIKTNNLVEVDEDQNGNLMPPSLEVITRLTNAKTIFTYTHLVPYFQYYISPRINTPFTLVTHNSDHAVTIMNFQLLNHPYLKNWFAQNCEFSHTKLKPLPLGLQNRQWGHEKYEQLLRASKNIIKTSLLYANFSVQTHPSRTAALELIKELPYATVELGVEYEVYLKNLSMHKFCVCPRGNGIDTHRFWEAQYLDTIPIILWRDWTSSYSGMPILILDNWGELRNLDLEKIYITITTKGYERANLDLQELRQKIMQ